jgi:hypothetical protein
MKSCRQRLLQRTFPTQRPIMDLAKEPVEKHDARGASESARAAASMCLAPNLCRRWNGTHGLVSQTNGGHSTRQNYPKHQSSYQTYSSQTSNEIETYRRQRGAATVWMVVEREIAHPPPLPLPPHKGSKERLEKGIRGRERKACCKREAGFSEGGRAEDDRNPIRRVVLEYDPHQGRITPVHEPQLPL